MSVLTPEWHSRSSSPGDRRTWVRRGVAVWMVSPMAALMAVLSGCRPLTDIQLSRYRNPDAVVDYRYALGERYLEVNGITLCYQEFGQGEPLLLLHGVGTSSDFWQRNVEELAKHFRVLAVDLPGFAHSDKPDASYDLRWICRQIVNFLNAKGVEEANVLGASMGGHLALLLALDYPERFPRVVMTGSCGAWEPPGPLMCLAFDIFWHQPIVIDHLRRNWEGIFRQLFRHNSPMTERIFDYQMAVRADVDLFRPEGRASMRSLKSIFFSSCRDRLHLVSQPVLLLWGEGDIIHPPVDGRFFFEHLPYARMVEYTEANHEVMVDRADDFNKEVIRFLTGDDAPS